jgi:hypothetical protein
LVSDEELVVMSTPTDKHIRRIVEIGAVLVIIAIGLNFLVTVTLGSLEVSSVLLTLYVSFWAYVLGNVMLIVLSIWLFVRRKFSLPDRRSVRQEIEDHEGAAGDLMCPRKVA